MTIPNSSDRSRTEVDRVIERATEILIEAAHPEKIILFGSYARGDFHRGSDLDLLVILTVVESRFDEMVRLRHALRDIPMAIDLVVYSSERVKERQHLRGTMLYHALSGAGCSMRPHDRALELV